MASADDPAAGWTDDADGGPASATGHGDRGQLALTAREGASLPNFSQVTVSAYDFSCEILARVRMGVVASNSNAVKNDSRRLFAAALDHHQAGRLADAASLYQILLADAPDHSDALHLYGVIAYQQGDDEAAEERIRRAIALRGDSASYHSNLGNVLRRQRRLPEAAECYRRAVNLKSDFTDGHNNLGTVLFDLGHFKEARQAYQNAVSLQPDHVDALSNLGSLLRAMGQMDEARPLYERALSLRPGHGGALVGLGAILRESGSLEIGESHFRAALATNPRQAEALNGLGNCHRAKDQLIEATELYRKALAVQPDFPEAHCNLGKAYQALGQLEEAEVHLRRALALRPRQPEAMASLGLFLLQTGRFEEGWPLYEARWRNKGMNGHGLTLPPWEGGELSGRTILLHCEQGLGDNIQFIRYAPLIKAKGAQVILRTPSALLDLFRGAEGVGSLLPDGEMPPECHCRAALLSLPGILGTTVETIPGRVPYLRADPAKMTEWRGRLASMTGPRIGIVWRGNPTHLNDRNRSLSAEMFSRFLPQGHGVVSLQKEATAAEIAALSAARPVLNAGPDLADLTDTAALVACLDLVVSVDTSVCHLAGALAVPVWTLLPFSPDWRWLLGRGDSPWYPTMRLVRQPRPGDWTTVIKRVGGDLATLVGGEVSTGQIYSQALAHHGENRLDEAQARLDRLLASQPGHSDALHLSGLIALQRGRMEDAIGLIRRAITAKSNVAAYHSNLAEALRLTGRLNEAVESLRQTASLAPGRMETHRDLSGLLLAQGRLEEAEPCLRHLARLRPNDPVILYNLGLLLLRLDSLDEAIRCFRQVITSRPGFVDAHNGLGNALKAQGRLDEAIAAYRVGLRVVPGDARARMNLGIARLLAGDLSGGWADYEYRWRLRPDEPRKPEDFNQPRWQGETPAGRTILLWAEQGFGDTIQFARYAPLLAGRGWKVVLEVPRPLLSLLRELPGVQAIARGEELPPFDVHCPLLGTPGVAGTRLENIPSPPVLGMEPERLTYWRNRLQGLPGRKVGIVWRGNPGHQRDRTRSIDPALFGAALHGVADIAVVSLQKGAKPSELEALAIRQPLLDCGSFLTDFAETAAVVSQLDLVVTVDTSLCHLGATLGVPTWALVEFVPDWRWLIGREDSPWYPSLRLFRQPERGNWRGVVERVRRELKRRLPAGSISIQGLS